MTFGNVMPSPPNVVEDDIRIGSPVLSSTQWLDLAKASNYLNSHEMSLVAATSIGDYVTSSTPGSYDFKFLTRQQVISVIWVIVLRAISGGNNSSVSGTVTVDYGVGPDYPFTISSSGEMSDPTVITILETRAQTSTAYWQNIVVIKTAGDADIRVEQIAAYQIRRYSLEISASPCEYGIDLPSCSRGAIIRDEIAGSEGYSVGGIVSGIVTAKENCRRASMFAWAAHSSGIYIGQGASWNALFHESPEVLARYLTSGVTSTAVSISVKAAPANDGASFGYIRFVIPSGDTATIAVALGGGLTIYNTSILIRRENLSSDDGRYVEGTPCRMNIEVWGNSNTVAVDGNYAMHLYSICIGES